MWHAVIVNDLLLPSLTMPLGSHVLQARFLSMLGPQVDILCTYCDYCNVKSDCINLC